MGGVGHDLGHQGGAIRHACCLGNHGDPGHAAGIVLTLGNHLVGATVCAYLEGACCLVRTLPGELPPGVVVLEATTQAVLGPGVGKLARGKVGTLYAVDGTGLGLRIADVHVGA